MKIDLIEAGFDAVKGYIDRGFAAVFTRLAALEARTPVNGENGRDGRDGLPGRQGEKGIDGKDGVDGLGFGDLDAVYDGERTFTLKCTRDDKTKAWEFSIPCMIYRGVWRDGDFHRGDTVTHGGSMWVAMKNTSTKPDTPGCEWQLSVKRGRDGKDGKPGERGAKGEAGTQGPRGDRAFGI